MVNARSGRSAGSGGVRSQRQLRVGELVRRALVEIFERTELRDPDIAGTPVTVSEVTVSPDLRSATAYVMPLGGERQDAVLAGLVRAAPFLRSQVARRVTLRRVPELAFRIDTAFDSAGQMSALLQSIRPVSDAGEAGDAS